MIDYVHSPHVHSTIGAERAFGVIASLLRPHSVLDVGCGTGTWIRAALLCGITDIMGIDGVAITDTALLFPRDKFRILDLTKDWDLSRKFDVALCLEVAEHLEDSHSKRLVGALTAHADCVVFSAAVPGQPGQHHVNCQWPEYWQCLFNQHGFHCDDSIRWRIWDDELIEPWYRQNMIVARRGELAGKEPRIRSVVHPAMLGIMLHKRPAAGFKVHVARIAQGRMPSLWYAKLPLRVLYSRLLRQVVGVKDRDKNGART